MLTVKTNEGIIYTIKINENKEVVDKYLDKMNYEIEIQEKRIDDFNCLITPEGFVLFEEKDDTFIGIYKNGKWVEKWFEIISVDYPENVVYNYIKESLNY